MHDAVCSVLLLSAACPSLNPSFSPFSVDGALAGCVCAGRMVGPGHGEGWCGQSRWCSRVYVCSAVLLSLVSLLSVDVLDVAQ